MSLRFWFVLGLGTMVAVVLYRCVNSFFSLVILCSQEFFSFTEDFFFLHKSLFFYFQEMEKGGGGQGYCGVQVLVHFILDFQIF